VVTDLIRSLDDPNVSVEQLARRISLDQAITARTLRMANSSFFGLPRQVASVLDAASVLGLRSVRNIALAAGVAEVFAAAKCPGFDFTEFWRHSIGAALCAEAAAQYLDQDTGMAFTLGLLHDIGRLALASGFPQPYSAVMAWRIAHDATPLEAEQAVLGIDHAKVGLMLTEHWQFAPALCEAIGSHHAPGESGTAASTPMSDLLHLADNMAHGLDLSHSPDDIVPPLSAASWGRLGLSDAQLFSMFSQTERRHEAVCQAILS
uniref:HDOD domain-containing protein n=1 Tax=Pelomonas sp. KK5 TaxID=1855730 RepID=UPI00097C28CF